MYGTVVKVCKKGGACTQCGPSAAAVPTGQWAYFVCPYSVRGNQIKLSQDYSNLAFCEIDIACDEDVKFGNEKLVHQSLRLIPRLFGQTFGPCWRFYWREYF